GFEELPIVPGPEAVSAGEPALSAGFTAAMRRSLVAGIEEARRREERAVLGLLRVVDVDPQGIRVPDAFGVFPDAVPAGLRVPGLRDRRLLPQARTRLRHHLLGDLGIYVHVDGHVFLRTVF